MKHELGLRFFLCAALVVMAGCGSKAAAGGDESSDVALGADADAAKDETSTDTGPADSGPDIAVDTGPQGDTTSDGAEDGQDGGVDVDSSATDVGPDVVQDITSDSGIDAEPDTQDSNIAQLDADDAPLTDAVEDVGAADGSNPDGEDTKNDSDAGGNVLPTACTVEADCTAGGGVCDPLNLSCVECVVDSACPANNHCQGYNCVPFTPCMYVSECKGVSLPTGQAASWCDHFVGECAECRTSADCPATNDCIAKQCVPYKACTKSTQCPGVQICDTGTQHCVDCTADADCPNALCLNHKCVPIVAPTTCASDTACKSQGLICDKTAGKCAQCLTDADCPAEYNCQVPKEYGVGRCVVDECAAGQERWAPWVWKTCGGLNGAEWDICSAAGVWAVSHAGGTGIKANCEDGSVASKWGFVCGITQVPVLTAGKAACLVPVCAPGPTCVGNSVQVCDADGIQLISTTPCGTSETCDADACKPWLCTPGAATGCMDGTHQSVCNVDGLGTAVVNCPSSTTCVGGSCEPWVCTPKLPVCDANTPAIGADDGLSVIPSGTTCNSACLNGACINCDAVNQCQIGPLLWQFTPTSTDMSASDAQAYCENLDLAGYTDWRLPVFQETDGGSINASYDWILPGESFLMGMPLALEPTFDLSATYLRGPVGCPSGGKCTAMGLKVFSNTVSNGKKILKMGMIGKFVETGRVRCVRP